MELLEGLKVVMQVKYLFYNRCSVDGFFSSFSQPLILLSERMLSPQQSPASLKVKNVSDFFFFNIGARITGISYMVDTMSRYKTRSQET